MVIFSHMDWSTLGICLTREVGVLHYASHLPSIADHSREMFKPLRVNLISLES